MARYRLIAAAALVALAAISHCGAVAAADEPVPPGTVGEVDDHIEQGLDDNRVPGAALAIVDRRGPIQLRGFGEARDGEAATAHTPFILCSVSKSFTALAVMQLAEAGSIQLDAPVQRYLPWFEVVPADASDEVTVRQLLNQTSGIAADAGDEALRFLSDASILATARTLIGTELNGEPGQDFEYANGNYALLGAIVEAVSGGSYGDYVRASILDPLGMRETFLALEPAQDAGLADGHRYWFGWTAPHTSYSEGLLSTGAIISTAADMGRYMRMYLNEGELDGERVLSRGGIREMTAPAAEAEVGPWSQGGDVFYGMGLFSGSGVFGDEPAVFHPGGSPDFGSMMVLFPARGVGLTLLYNATPEVDLPGARAALDRIPPEPLRS